MPKIIKNGVTYIGTSDNAAAVSYDNTLSGLNATTAQGAIDEVNSGLSDLKQAVIDTIYPVGSIYMSVSSTNPGTIFGVGTWEAWGSGRVPVGVDSNDTSFDTVEETGGNKSNSYTPAGTNSGCAVNAHTYTPAGTNSGCAVNAHTYTPAGTIGGHTLTAAQSGVHSHTHTITNTRANPSGIHTHGDYVIRALGASEASGYGLTVTAGFRNRVLVHSESSSKPPANNGIATIADSGAHTHTINSTSNDASESHTHSWTGTKATLSHTVTQPKFSGTQASLTHTVTQPTFKGTAANISTVQPYITCYMWKRTA